jgi:hypothetical protein
MTAVAMVSCGKKRDNGGVRRWEVRVGRWKGLEEWGRRSTGDTDTVKLSQGQH